MLNHEINENFEIIKLNRTFKNISSHIICSYTKNAYLKRNLYFSIGKRRRSPLARAIYYKNAYLTNGGVDVFARHLEYLVYNRAKGYTRFTWGTTNQYKGTLPDGARKRTFLRFWD